MSTASLPPQAKPNQPHPSDGLIAARIEAVRSALWRSELTRSLLLLVLFLIGALLGWAIIDQWIWSGGPLLRLAAWTATAALVIVWSARRIVPLFTSRVDASYAAFSIEQDIPDIKHALSSYVALRDQRDTSGLRGVVVRSIGTRAASRLQQHAGELPSEVRGSFRLGIMVAVAFAVLVAYFVFSPKNTIDSAGRLIMPLASIEPPTRVRILEVEPGHTEVLAGRKLEIKTRIAGLKESDQPHVLAQFGSHQQRVPLRIDEQRGSSSFQALLGGSHGIESSGYYTIKAGDASSERFEITTSDVPVIHVESVHYQPPAYTKRPEHTTRTAAIEGIEGTTVTLVATTNRPIVEAHLELNPRTAGGRTTATAGVFPMKIDPEGTRITAKIQLRIGADQPGVVPLSSYRMLVTDSSGAQNPEPIIHPIRILPDLAPEVTIATPVRNPKDVPVDAQQLIEVHALDPDFGLRRVALQMERGPQRLEDVVLWEEEESDPRNRVALYRLRPRELGLHPGDVLKVRAVAADNRIHPTKQSPAPNVTVSDPVELRIVDVANLNESRPSEDGLSATDDQPAVEPAKDDQAESQDQQDGDGESSSTESGSNGGSGSTDEGTGEGESSDGGSPSEGTAEGQQEDGSRGDQNGEGTGEGSGSEAGDQTGAGSGGDQNGNDGGESGQQEMAGDSSTGDADAEQSPTGEKQPAGAEGSGADSAVQPSPSQTETGGEQTQSPESTDASGDSVQGADAEGTDAGGANTEGTDGEGTGAETTGSQEDADASAADGGASDDGQGSPQGMNEPPREGTATGEQGDSSSPAESPPEHDGEAFERIKDYLDEQSREGGRTPSADQEGAGDSDAVDRETPANGAPSNAEQRDASSRDSAMSDDASNGEPSSSGGTSSDRGEQAPDSADGQAGSDDSSSGDPSEGEPSSEGASEQNGAGATSERESPDGASQTEQDSTESPADSAADASTAEAKSSSSEPSEPGSKSGDPSATADAEATPSTQDAATDETQSQDPSASPSAQQPSGDPSQAADGSDQPDGSPPSATENSATTGRDGATGSGETTSEFADSNETPEPVDMEYAKKATDMVLDYLKETRDQPDQELLDRLNWSEEDLERFLNRWESARQMQRGDGGEGTQEFEEALRSLGMRDRSTAARGDQTEQADQLRDLRDSGTRRPAPTLYRDAFEAFRRSVAR